MNSDETQLKQLFSELRAENAKHAPSFDRTIHAARARRHKATVRTFRLAPLAASLLVAGLCAAIFMHHRPAATRAAAPIAKQSADFSWENGALISQWRSPTDFLLNQPSEWTSSPLLDFSSSQPNKN